MVNPDRIKALCHPEVFKRVPELQKLRVKHNRRYIIPTIGIITGNVDEAEIVSRGGDTTVVLVISNEEYQGFALCSLSDNFCKKTGRELAFKRAIRKYWDTLPLDVRRLKEGEQL